MTSNNNNEINELERLYKEKRVVLEVALDAYGLNNERLETLKNMQAEVEAFAKQVNDEICQAKLADLASSLNTDAELGYDLVPFLRSILEQTIEQIREHPEWFINDLSNTEIIQKLELKDPS